MRLLYCLELQTLVSLKKDQVVHILNLTVAEPHRALGKLVTYTTKELHLASRQKSAFTSRLQELVKVLAARIRAVRSCISAPTELSNYT